VEILPLIPKPGYSFFLGLGRSDTPDSLDPLRRAHSVHLIAAIRVKCPPFALDIEDETTGPLKTARELGVKLISSQTLPLEGVSPLAAT
jgi:hypothetical protein